MHKLRSTINRRSIQRAIASAWTGSLIVNVTYEHGQWWVINHRTDEIWSVVDANTPSGFDFEQVRRGDLGRVF
jgi:hypothetical protein